MRYQACEYNSAVDQLVDVLPTVDAVRSLVRGHEQAALHTLAADAHHVAASVLLKLGEPTYALVAAERSSACGIDSGDPVTVGASARIMTHALIGNGHHRRAVTQAQAAADALDRDTGPTSVDAGFGPTNVLQHRANIALALGDAGSSIAYARQI